MKINDGFVLRKIAGNNVVIPVGKRAADLNGMITLNDTGAFIWRQLTEETTVDKIVGAITEAYEVEPERARDCVCSFLAKLKEVGCLD